MRGNLRGYHSQNGDVHPGTGPRGDYQWVEEKIRLNILSIMLGFACTGDAVLDIPHPRQWARWHCLSYQA
jgi:hypothetical protein